MSKGYEMHQNMVAFPSKHFPKFPDYILKAKIHEHYSVVLIKAFVPNAV